MNVSGNDFAELVLSKIPADRSPGVGPFIDYDDDGDCLEFFTSNDNFVAERIDSVVTVYYRDGTDEIIGGLLKGIRSIVDSLKQQYPGFAVEVEDGQIGLAFLVAAKMWTDGDRVRVLKYKKLRQAARDVEDRSQDKGMVCV